MKKKSIILFIFALLSTAFAIYVIISVSKTLKSIDLHQRLFYDKYTFEVYKQTMWAQLCNGISILLCTWSFFLLEQQNIFNPNCKKYDFNFFKPIIYYALCAFFLLLFSFTEAGKLSLLVVAIPTVFLLPLSLISLIISIVNCVKNRKNTIY